MLSQHFQFLNLKNWKRQAFSSYSFIFEKQKLKMQWWGAESIFNPYWIFIGHNTPWPTTFSCIIIVYVQVFWFESCLGNTLFDTILCVIMQGILYLHPTSLVRGCVRHVFSLAFDSSSPLNDESNESWRQHFQ